jgi:hypothetical protein
MTSKGCKPLEVGASEIQMMLSIFLGGTFVPFIALAAYLNLICLIIPYCLFLFYSFVLLLLSVKSNQSLSISFNLMTSDTSMFSVSNI